MPSQPHLLQNAASLEPQQKELVTHSALQFSVKLQQKALVARSARLQEDMKQWALDMDEPASNLDQSEQEKQGAEEPDILQQAAALEEQGSNADATAASQQGSQETSDSFQETGQYERLIMKTTCMVSVHDELPVTSRWLRGCQETPDSFQETGQYRRSTFMASVYGEKSDG